MGEQAKESLVSYTSTDASDFLMATYVASKASNLSPFNANIYPLTTLFRHALSYSHPLGLGFSVYDSEIENPRSPSQENPNLCKLPPDTGV